MNVRLRAKSAQGFQLAVRGTVVALLTATVVIAVWMVPELAAPIGTGIAVLAVAVPFVRSSHNRGDQRENGQSASGQSSKTDVR